MRHPSFSLPLPAPAPADRCRGFAPAPPSVGASQRASLGRGVAFVLVLAASSLASVYVPLACHGPDWVEGAGPTRAAAR